MTASNTVADVRRLLEVETVEVCPSVPVDQETHLDLLPLSDRAVSEKKIRTCYSRTAKRSTFGLSKLSCPKVEGPHVELPLHYSSLNQDRVPALMFWQLSKYCAMIQKLVVVAKLKVILQDYKEDL